MVIIETSVLTRQVSELLTDDEYRKLQVVLPNRPVGVGRRLPDVRAAGREETRTEDEEPTGVV
jgi:hypothetical protein